MSVKTRRGDTMIEVMFGVAVFSLIAIVTINLMNNGLASSENNLEATMARNEMNAQAEAIRFIHSAYAASGSAYESVWKGITSNITDANDVSFNDDSGCERISDNLNDKAFVLNTNAITNNTQTIIANTSTTDSYPYIDTSGAHGIWVNVVKPSDSTRYYDFYINSCWYGIGASAPTRLDTVVRLYNPDWDGSL